MNMKTSKQNSLTKYYQKSSKTDKSKFLIINKKNAMQQNKKKTTLQKLTAETGEEL